MHLTMSSMSISLHSDTQYFMIQARMRFSLSSRLQDAS